MKRLLRTLAAVATTAVASAVLPVHAQGSASRVEQWTPDNATFSSGGSLTGYPAVNAVTHALLTWSVTPSGGLVGTSGSPPLGPPGGHNIAARGSATGSPQVTHVSPASEPSPIALVLAGLVVVGVAFRRASVNRGGRPL